MAREKPKNLMRQLAWAAHSLMRFSGFFQAFLRWTKPNVCLYLTLVLFRYAPEIGDFVYITDNAYSQSQIREMEIKIMGVLKFDLGRPLPLHFLRRNSKAGQLKTSSWPLLIGVACLQYSLVEFLHFAILY